MALGLHDVASWDKCVDSGKSFGWAIDVIMNEIVRRNIISSSSGVSLDYIFRTLLGGVGTTSVEDIRL